MSVADWTTDPKVYFAIPATPIPYNKRKKRGEPVDRVGKATIPSAA